MLERFSAKLGCMKIVYLVVWVLIFSFNILRITAVKIGLRKLRQIAEYTVQFNYYNFKNNTDLTDYSMSELLVISRSVVPLNLMFS